MNTAATLPHYDLKEKEGSRTISIGDWEISVTTGSIVSASEADVLQKTLGFPLPEMTFGNNSLELHYKRSGWSYKFSTGHALNCVKNGELEEGDGGVKVGYADAWIKSR